MKYDTVIFDLDGTLINTIPDIAHVVNSVLGKAGIKTKTETEICSCVGFGVEHLLHSLGVPEHLNSALTQQVTDGYSRIGNSEASLYPGVVNMINEISEAGLRIFVLSNKPQEGLEKSVSDHLSFADFLDARGSLPGKPAKPSPDTMLQMLSCYKADHNSTLMVGDGEPDIQVSRAAGVDCLSVLWGFRTRELLEKAGANMFATTPRDVVNYILREEQ